MTVQVPFRQVRVEIRGPQKGWPSGPPGKLKEMVVGDVGVWQELMLIGAAVLVMGMVCALEGWSR
jgi:hypothetical protein